MFVWCTEVVNGVPNGGMWSMLPWMFSAISVVTVSNHNSPSGHAHLAGVFLSIKEHVCLHKLFLLVWSNTYT